MSVRPLVLLASAVALSLVTFPCRADDTEDSCVASSLEGQVLERANRLERARARYLECARTECQAAGTRTRCAAWAAAIVPAIPTMTISVVDDRGGRLPEAELLLDGVATKWNAPINVDPGHHTARAQYAGRTRTIEVDVKKGDHATLPIAIDLRRFVADRPTPTWVKILGGVSLAGFGSFGVFGGLTLAKKNDLESCRPICNPDERAPLERNALLADVSLGIGVAALAGTVVGYLIRPTRQLEERVVLEPGASR